MTFIDTYRRFYFDNDISDEEKRYYGIPLNLKTTNSNAETWIVDNRLNEGIFDEYALAWKAGRIDWEDGHIVYKDFIEGQNYKNGLGYRIDISSFNDYCDSIAGLDCSGELRNIYKIMQGLSPNNIGPVYNITALFFLSKGKFPIYDEFAHKAVRALACNMKPTEVYIGSNPAKDAISKVMCMYKEYMLLLRKVFPQEENENSTEPFISRELDQALWVYGHASKRWSLEENRVID